jgi:hypothetical protein
METSRIREQSIRTAAALGVFVPATLPLPDAEPSPRTTEDATTRLLVMHAVAAVAYGFDRMRAMAWLNAEALADALTEPERRFVVDAQGSPGPFRSHIEGMWALAWATRIVDELDFRKDCDARFATMLPNLKRREPSASVRAKAALRDPEEIVAACDLAYCLHWALVQAELDNGPPPAGLAPLVVVERRRALEWLLGTEEWESVSLDT